MGQPRSRGGGRGETNWIRTVVRLRIHAPPRAEDVVSPAESTPTDGATMPRAATGPRGVAPA
eukprot:8164119-Pyramimonas_sp.AAC.1